MSYAMKSLRQLFEYMNDISFEYVVLRNWENLPDSVEYGDHSDLDLLVYDFNHWREVFPNSHSEFPYPRVRFKIPINDTYIFADIRSVGDGYYPADFQQQILENREFNKNGFWTPSPLHHRLALAYHVVHHKNSNTYPNWLGDITSKELLVALKKSTIGWVPPVDKSVGTFNAYWNGATSLVSKGDGFVTKKQDSFMAYSLIDNEERILSHISSIHFPKVISRNEGELSIEDCGELLTEDNLPDNWKEQLIRIIIELRTNNVQHRDIKPDNLMIKNGIIKLIDFGWAKFEDEEDKVSPPACLGYPFRPSWGWDDNYSMKQVIKQMEYNINKKQEEIFV